VTYFFFWGGGHSVELYVDTTPHVISLQVCFICPQNKFDYRDSIGSSIIQCEATTAIAIRLRLDQSTKEALLTLVTSHLCCIVSNRVRHYTTYKCNLRIAKVNRYSTLILNTSPDAASSASVTIERERERGAHYDRQCRDVVRGLVGYITLI